MVSLRRAHSISTGRISNLLTNNTCCTLLSTRAKKLRRKNRITSMFAVNSKVPTSKPQKSGTKWPTSFKRRPNVRPWKLVMTTTQTPIRMKLMIN